MQTHSMSMAWSPRYPTSDEGPGQGFCRDGSPRSGDAAGHRPRLAVLSIAVVRVAAAGLIGAEAPQASAGRSPSVGSADVVYEGWPEGR
jgi:hypothetical protein